MKNYVESFGDLSSLNAFLNQKNFLTHGDNPIKKIFKVDGNFYVWYEIEVEKEYEQ